MKSLTKIIVILISGVVLAILLMAVFISPVMKEVSALNTAVAAKNVELAILNQQIRAFKNAQSDLAKATRKDDVLNALATKENLVAAVLDLEKAANLTQTEEVLQIKEVGPKEKPSVVISKKVGVEEIPYEINTVDGDFTHALNFISYLEHLPHFTELSKFTLAGELSSGTGLDAVQTGRVFGDINAVFFTNTKAK